MQISTSLAAVTMLSATSEAVSTCISVSQIRGNNTVSEEDVFLLVFRRRLKYDDILEVKRILEGAWAKTENCQINLGK